MNHSANNTERTGHHSNQSCTSSSKNPRFQTTFSFFIYKSACLLPKPATGKCPTIVMCFPRYGSETWVKRHKTHLGIGVLV